MEPIRGYRAPKGRINFPAATGRIDTSGNPMHQTDRSKLPRIDRVKIWQPDIDKTSRLPYRPGGRPKLDPMRYVDVVEAFVKRNR